MRLRDDERGVTVQIGAILLFAVLVILLSTYQAYVVPQENAAVEFQHSQAVENDLVSVRSSMLTMADTGENQPTAVKLGVQYPVRAFFVNPPPATGALYTDSYGNASNVTINNIKAAQPSEDQGLQNFLNKSRWNLSYPTKALVYNAHYNIYDNAPPARVIEYGLLYNDYAPSETVPSGTQQVLLSGSDENPVITVVTLTGSYHENGVTATSVDFEALSTGYNEVEVTAENGSEYINLTFPSKMPASRWQNRTTMNRTRYGNGTWNYRSYVENITSVPDGNPSDDTYRIRLVLNGSKTYTLRAAKLGLGSNTNDPGPAYITRVGDDTVQVGETVTFVVRDRYNNPVSDVTVKFANRTETPDSDGQVQFSISNPGTYNATVIGQGIQSIPVTVEERGTGNGGNDTAPYAITWDTTWIINNNSGVEYSSGNDTLLIYTSEAPNPITVTANVTQNNSSLAGVFVDYASKSKGVISGFSPSEATTDENGQAVVDMHWNFGNGNTTIYATPPGGSDSLKVQTVGSGAGRGPQIAFRLDDLSHQQESSVEYIGSYTISNTNSSFQRVEIQYRNTNDDSASQTLQKGAPRGGLTYTSSHGAGATYEVTVRVIYGDGQGGTYVAASQTVTDVADAVNPSGNDDLSTSSTASLASSAITDQSSNGQGPRYRFSYTVSNGGYSQTRLVVVSTTTGGKASRTLTTRDENNVRVSPGYGYDEEFKVAILVFGPDGAVVDVRIVTDTADGSGP